jgi:sensor domain CHASE-containing protein
MLILVGAIAAVLLVLYALSRIILLDSFVALEEREVDQETHRVIDTLQDELASLNRISHGWSQSDETYQFIEDHNPAYFGPT